MTQLETRLPDLLRIFTAKSKPARYVYLVLSIAFAAGYAWLAIAQVLGNDYVIQDDARQHIFWMQRYIDPGLFPGDYIADYFQGMAPVGYRSLYRFLALMNIPPKLASNILPLLLSIMTAYYSYALSLAFFPIPLSAFLSSLLLSQSLWYSSELASATPRGFLYPLLLAFLYYLISRKQLVVLLVIALEACFYPQIALISLGVLFLRLFLWKSQRITLSRSRVDYQLFGASFLIIAGIVLFSKTGNDFGEIVTRTEAMAMPEFQPGGRNSFFAKGLKYWFHGRSGLFHQSGFVPPAICAGIGLPLLLKTSRSQPLKKLIHPSMGVLIYLLIASLGLYSLSHIFLFELHLPSRYSSHSLRLAIALTSGISWIFIFNLIFQGFLKLSRLSIFCRPNLRPKHLMKIIKTGLHPVLPFSLSTFILVGIIAYPFLFLETFPKVGYENLADGRPLYEFFAQQPKDSLIASLSGASSNIPYFSQRSVLVSPEHAIAYHKGYYGQLRQRTIDLITAQYTTDPVVLQTFIEQYGIDFWLLDNLAFQPDYPLKDLWIQQYQPATQIAIQQLQQGKTPLLQVAAENCTVFDTAEAVVLKTSCIIRTTQVQP